MIKLTDTLMAYHYKKGEQSGKLFVTINNDPNEDGSLYAAAFDEKTNLISEVFCKKRNEIGYLLRDKLVEFGYEMEEFRISKESGILENLYLKHKEY